MRNYKTSKFTTTIGITPESKLYIFQIKGKRSMAGALEEIINNHKINVRQNSTKPGVRH